MKNLLNFIPGFRSGNKIKRAIAIVYYLLSLIMLFAVPEAGLIFFSIPFIFFYGVELFKNLKNPAKIKKAIVPFLVACIIFGAGISTDTTATDSTNTEQQAIKKVEETETQDDVKATEKENQAKSNETPSNKEEKLEVTGDLKVHFLNVGQADSILIQDPSGKNILIDAGNNEDSDLVVNYIKDKGINKLDYVVGTHPHEDHIGGLDVVINNFDIGKVYMPKVTHTSQTFKDVRSAIKNNGLKVTVATPGDTFNLGSAKCTILAPNSSSYDDLNNYSVVIKMEYGDTSFLFAGDAEDVSENEMISKEYDLSANVLKVGHHGSDSSTTSSFLSAVSPKYAVISVGADNSYGHPSSSTMDRLKANDIQVYRTDENGTIVATSDGENITFNTDPGSYASRDASSGGNNGSGTSSSSSSGSSSSSNNSKDTTYVAPAPAPEPQPEPEPEPEPAPSSSSGKTVYYTPNGKSYHYSKDCPTLSRSKTIIDATLDQAINTGHGDPCNVCTQ